MMWTYACVGLCSKFRLIKIVNVYIFVVVLNIDLLMHMFSERVDQPIKRFEIV